MNPTTQQPLMAVNTATLCTGRPHGLARVWATMRAITSLVPPAGSGLMILTALLGQASWALVVKAVSVSAAATATRRARRVNLVA